MGGNAQTTSHSNAINERHDGLGILRNITIQRVFGGEESIDLIHFALLDPFAGVANIAAGAICLGTSRGKQHLFHLIIVAPLRQRLRNEVDHFRGEGIESLGAVELNDSGMVTD